MNIWNKRYGINSRSVTPPPNIRNAPRDKSPINFSTAQKSQKSLKNMNMSISGSVVENNEADSFKVYIRSRPISEKELNSVEIGKEPNIIKKEDNMVIN